MFAHNPHHGSGQAVLPHPVAEICAVRRDSVARHLRRKRPNRYRYQDRSRAPTTRGSRATGIPFTDITAGMKVIGRVLRMPAPVGQVHALKAAFSTTATGTVIAAASSVAMNGITIVIAIMTGIASTKSIATCSRAAARGEILFRGRFSNFLS